MLTKKTTLAFAICHMLKFLIMVNIFLNNVNSCYPNTFLWFIGSTEVPIVCVLSNAIDGHD